MSRRNKSEYRLKAYESVGKKFTDKNGTQRTDTFASIFESMLLSKAFTTLTARQKMLYVLCKAQIVGKRKPKEDYKEYDLYQNEECFYLHEQALIDYGLYSKASRRFINPDFKKLEEHGLIKKLASGQKSKSKNVYKLVSDWQRYG